VKWRRVACLSRHFRRVQVQRHPVEPVPHVLRRGYDGIHTDDGAVVARVSIWDGTSIDRRSREKAAMEKAERLAAAFSAAMK
jgi:hypothetical protein